MTDKPDWLESHERSVVGMAILASAQEWIDCLSNQENGTFIRLFLPDKIKAAFDQAAQSMQAEGTDPTSFETTIFTLLILDGMAKVIEEKGNEMKLKIMKDILWRMTDERESRNSNRASSETPDEDIGPSSES